MEEVDGIILQSLREIGCDVGENMHLKSLSSEEIFNFIGTLCKYIKHDFEDKVPSKLPHQMAQRFAAASNLVDCCRSLGFKGSLGYQTILYSNVNELRHVLMWLIERIPKLDDKTDALQPGIVHKGKSMENEFIGKLTADLKSPWMLEFLQPKCNSSSATEHLIHHREDFPQYKQRFEPPMVHETREIPNKLGNLLVSDKSVQNDAQSKSKPSGVEALAESISEIKRRIETEDVTHRKLTADQMEQRKSIEVDVMEVEKLKQRNKLKSRVALLLDQPGESKEKLVHSLQANKKKILSDKFESHKQRLEDQLRELLDANSGKVHKSDAKIEEREKLKLKTAAVQADLKTKIQILNQLKTGLSQIRKTAHRSAHTSRIFDIVKSIEKQNIDIAGIIEETKSVQKSINNSVGQNQRQFTVTEDVIWNNTNKKDEYSKKAYKLLISLHSEFSELIDLVENTGSIQREIRDLEDLINLERQQNVQRKLDQIKNDLEIVAGGVAGVN